MLSANSFISLSHWIIFIDFSSLTALARNSSTILNTRGESGCPCFLVPGFRGKAFNCSPLSMMLIVGLCYGLDIRCPSKAHVRDNARNSEGEMFGL